MTALTSPGFKPVGFRDIGGGPQIVSGASAVYWFGEGSGQILHDYSGNDNNGTFGSGGAAPTWGPQGVSFDGNDSIVIPNMRGIKTISLVFYLATPITAGTPRVFLLGTDAPAYGGVILGSISSATVNEIVTINLQNSSKVAWCDEFASISIGWHSLSCIFTGTSWDIILDGVSKPTTIVGAPVAMNFSTPTVGTHAGGGFGFVGKFGNLLIYNTAISTKDRGQNSTCVNYVLTQRGIIIPFDMGSRWPLVMISFDDGDDSVYDVAYPILAAAGFKGNAYVNSSTIDVAGRMTSAQLTELYNRGWDICNHGATHANLVGMTDNQIITEIGGCADFLDSLGLLRSSHHLAYAGGGYDAHAISVCDNLGILSSRTVLTTAQPLPPAHWLELNGTVGIGLAAVSRAAIESAPPGNLIHIWAHAVGTTGGTYNRVDATGYDCLTSELQALVNYLVGAGITPVTVSELWDYVHRRYS